MTRAAIAPATVLLALLFGGGVAHAHPRIDEARASFAEADLDAAMVSLEEAFDVGHLTRQEYLEALVLRALVASARRLNATRDDALRQIGAIDPGFALPDEAPPSLRQRYAEILDELGGERVTAELGVDREENRFHARVRLSDPVRVVVSTSIVCRAGDDEVFRSEGREVFGLVPTWQSIECVAQLLGRGGTVLGELEETAAGRGTRPAVAAPSGGGGDDALAVGLVIGGSVLVAAAVAIILVFVLTGEDDGSDEIPSNDFFVPLGFTMP